MKTWKKMIVLALAAVLCIALAACGSSGKTVADIQKAGKLVVATSPDFPPFEYLENGQVVGIEAELMQMIADELGVELVIEEMDFDSVLPGVQAGKYDAGVAGITIDESRKKNADFTDPYFLASQSIVVMTGSNIQSKADLEGKTIAVQTGTTAEAYCMDNGYTVLAFQANNDACSALLTGKADAWVVDNEVAIDMSAMNDGATVVLDEKMTSEPYGAAFAKGSDDLVNAINVMIEKWIKDGTMENLFAKYEVPYVSPLD